MDFGNKRYFSFRYFVRAEEDRPLRIHQLRDGGGFAELAAVLMTQGYSYGGLIMNYPDAGLQVDTSFLGSGDVLVMTTRPPLDDEEGGLRRYVKRSHTTLEDIVFQTIRQYIRTCTRGNLRLTEEMADKLPNGFKNKAEMVFSLNRGAWYLQYKKYEGVRWEEPPEDRKVTATFLLYSCPLWENGPSLIASFGIGGAEGLIWNYLVRTQYPHLLQSPRFVMADMVIGDIPTMPLTLSFADDWEVNIFLDCPL